VSTSAEHRASHGKRRVLTGCIPLRANEIMIVVHGGDGSHSYRKLTSVGMGGGASHVPAGRGREPIVSAPKTAAIRILTTVTEPT
jgi:hypothetical protein